MWTLLDLFLCVLEISVSSISQCPAVGFYNDRTTHRNPKIFSNPVSIDDLLRPELIFVDFLLESTMEIDLVGQVSRGRKMPTSLVTPKRKDIFTLLSVTWMYNSR